MCVICKKVLLYIFFGSGLLILFSSCYRPEDFDFNKWANNQDVDYDLAMPLFETKLTINNLLYTFGNEENFPVDQEGLVHLIYTMPEPFLHEIGSRIKFSDIKMQALASGNIMYWKKDTVITTIIEEEIKIDIAGLNQGSELRKIVFDSMRFALSGQYTLAMASVLEVSFLNVFVDGAPLEMKINMEGGANIDYANIFKNIEIRFEGRSGTLPSIKYTIKCTSDFNTASNEYPNVKSGSFRFQPTFSHLVYNRIEGFIGEETFSASEDIPVPELSKWNINDFEFYKGDMKIYSNVYGCSLPVNIKSSKLKCFYKSPTPGSKELSLYPDNYILPYPELGSNPLEKITETSVDIKELLTSLPYKFTFDIDAEINSEQDAASALNVVEKNSGLALEMICDIPLWMRINDCVISDTIIFGGVNDIEMIRHFFLKGIVYNAFPIEMIVSMDFLDSRGNILFSPMDKDTVLSATVGPAPELHVIEPSIYRLDKELTVEEIQMLQYTRMIKVSARMNTYNNDQVRIYANSDTEGYISVKVGGRAVLQLGEILKPKER